MTSGTGEDPEAMSSLRTGEEPVPFDLAGPLPRGVTLLEASAGTGKTFTIAGLVTRYVAEGTELERLLVVTFTRLATSELRERVRERLLSTGEALEAALAGAAVDPTDPVADVLARGPRPVVAERAERLAKAVADFDAATIETTHGFCLHVLAGLGVAGDVERGATFVEDVPDLLDEVVDDLYVRRFAGGTERPPFDRKTAGEIGRLVLANPEAEILPAPGQSEGPAALRGRLARAVRSEVDRRKRAAGLLTYEDLLTRLARALADPERGPGIARWLRTRYQVALVDEFQDTDLVQWDIMRRSFGSEGSTLVLIGDPKQAIYAFRGADVHSYLQAGERAAQRCTLAVNWRSDQGLVDALDALFAGSRLGHPGIVYRRVVAAPDHQEPGIRGAPGAPLRVRIVRREDCGLTQKGFAVAAGAREAVAADLASEVVTLLESGAELRRPGGSPEALRPGHLAVLVRTNNQAATVRRALQEAGVPAVTHGSESVFGTPAARQWLHLLEALERPTSRERASAVALTPFVGWDAQRVATAQPEDWEELQWLLHRWAAVLRRRSVAALFSHLSASGQLPGRLLGRHGGERTLTDLQHLAELLHTTTKTESLGSTALAGWLRRRIREALAEANDEERSRRLESDAEAVQVLTVHRSKGLEFPVVLCPYLWDFGERPITIPVFHDPQRADARMLDVGGSTEAGFEEHCARSRDEQRGEDLRLMYVALTRARHQVVLWWASTYPGKDSPLARLLLARDPEGVVATKGPTPPSDEEVTGRFEELVDVSGGRIGVEPVVPRPLRRWTGPTLSAPLLEQARFGRSLDEEWRRTSYSALTAIVHEEIVGSEPEDSLVEDEVTDAGPGSGAGGEDLFSAAARSVRLALGDLPGGVEVGTFVHRVLERIDFAAPDLDGELGRVVAGEQAWRPLGLGSAEAWLEGLGAVIETPLGAGLGEVRLRDVGRSDRLDELGFELPLVGGDRPGGRLALSDVAALLEASEDPAGPVAGYARRLEDPKLQQSLRGYLTGSLDLVLRLSDGRYAVIDYKTNRLAAPPGEPASAWDYRPEAVGAEMFRAHYPLQALLYLVALHRYLRWRLPGYDPDRHLAGAHYLFVRGMSSPAFPRWDGRPCGVWSWHPRGDLVAALSDLFDQGAP